MIELFVKAEKEVQVQQESHPFWDLNLSNQMAAIRREYFHLLNYTTGMKSPTRPYFVFKLYCTLFLLGELVDRCKFILKGKYPNFKEKKKDQKTNFAGYDAYAVF